MASTTQTIFKMASPEPQITGVTFRKLIIATFLLGQKRYLWIKIKIKETDFNNFSTLTEYEFKKVENLPREETDASFITREEFEKWRNQYESIVQQIQPNIQLMEFIKTTNPQQWKKCCGL